MSRLKIIECPSCQTQFKIQNTNQTLKTTCKNCGIIFHSNSHKTISTNIRNIIIVASLAVFLALVYWENERSNASFRNWVSEKANSTNGNLAKSFFDSKNKSNWVTIDYGGLVDKSIITHSGETVGKVIRQIPDYTDDLKGLVQQYLEPYSILCHDVLLATVGPDTLPLINILNHYSVASEQPAWVGLFREGHFQLYYNNHMIRLFIKGDTPKESFNKYQSVVRHPILDLLASSNTSISAVEVYVFKNDYSTNKINLNTIPKTFSISEIDLRPKRKKIDLTSIENLLTQGVILEAIEVDDQNDLFLYGRKASPQTVAGNPLSLSDIAVVYRSIFHYGNNAPYISLDNHEDNRYAKVNFGGHLENTRMGNVVLEADKLFKALGTGIDPNTHQIIKTKITESVPEFLTQDERSLIDDSLTGSTQIRYWFYPDSIGTVTNGSIGAILTNQFLADVERMDIKANVSNSIRLTIDHLNDHFVQYENANSTFKELSTVGRVMALVNWLKVMNMDTRIELDDFLSVKIPAFSTPTKTKKMLAVTALAKSGNEVLNSHNVRNYTKTYYLSQLLDEYTSSSQDDFFLKVAGEWFSELDIADFAPKQYNDIQASIEYYDQLTSSGQSRLDKLEDDLNRKQRTLDNRSQREIDKYNDLVNEYNILLGEQESHVNSYNSKINQLNNMQIETMCITSIGGGINLRPKAFRRVSRNSWAPKIKDLKQVKNSIQPKGDIAMFENWIRSIPDNSRTLGKNRLQADYWEVDATRSGRFFYESKTNPQNYMSVIVPSKITEWECKTIHNGITSHIRYSGLSHLLEVQHEGFNIKAFCNISEKNDKYIFHN